ncbi:MAG: hypothetical protein N2511_07300 [Thermodesulfovibrionales bacterium]|nr:hypothetical protein [Thermodesulfovibrionales bacterium]
MKADDFKLKIELVPSTVWFSSVYQILKKNKKEERWKEIKRELFKREGRRCWICGKENLRLEAHEFWEYDDANHIQRLVAIHHLCALCHKIKHVGFWLHTQEGLSRLKEEGLTPQDLIDHFCRVNSCTPEDYEKAEEQAFETWRKRSRHKWKQDFGVWL